MIIYKTTNIVNGKIYIGFDTRNKSNYYGSGLKIKNALKKYGKTNFKKEIIEYCNTIEELYEREIYWIAYFHSRDDSIGYNIHKGGLGGNKPHDKTKPNPMLGRRHTEESKKIIGEKNKQHQDLLWQSADRQKLYSELFSGDKNPMFGKHHSEESKKTIGEKNNDNLHNWNFDPTLKQKRKLIFVEKFEKWLIDNNEVVLKIIDMYKNEISIKNIEKQTGVSFGKIKAILIRNNITIHLGNFKRNKNVKNRN